MQCPACEVMNEPAAETCYSCGNVLPVRRTPQDLARGMLVASRYEILATLGSGGMGTVYKAHDRVLDETVALKVMRFGGGLDPDMTRRFQLEIKLARKVTHKNVCRIHEYGEDAGLHFLSMEFIAGTNLKDVVRAQGGLLAEGALEVAGEIANGLQAIHDVGIVHRDLKTSNVMLDSRGVVRLLDFGIAKEQGLGQGGTLTGTIIGTPEYMSPEQARGERVDSRSDIYSMGIILFEIFTGRVPFHAESTMATLYKHVHEPPPLTGPGAQAIPAALLPVLRKALAKKPSERQATARELIDGLRRVQDSLFGSSSPAPSEVATVRAPAAGVRPPAPAANEADPLLKALDDVASTLGESPTLDQLLTRLASCAQEAVGGEVGRLILFETAERGGPIITAAGGDGGGELRGTALAPGEGLAALVAFTEAPILLARPGEHPRYSPRCDDLGRGAGLLGVPVRHAAVRGALLVAGRRAEDLRPADQDRLVRLGRYAAIAIAGVSAEERSLDAFTHTSDLLVSFLEQIDTLFASHSRNVAALADMLASRLGLSDTEQLRLHFAALLHDVGKLRVDPGVLRTEGPLSEDARRQLHGHVALGLQLLAPITPWPEMLEWIHGHHERWDGTGHPRGLAGERIPLASRIIAVADVFDAMTSRGLAPEEALTALEAVSGTQLDPRVVAQFASEQRDRLSRFQKA